MSVEINKLPFFFNSLESRQNNKYPEVLPFDLYFDIDFKMFRQRSNPQLNEILEKVYAEGSLAEGSISSESGKVYVSRVVDYISKHFQFDQEAKILEVGHGSGIILRELKKLNAGILTGVEPGNHKKVNGLEGIRLVHDFFPSKDVYDRYDLVFSLMVLEHIENPLQFVSDLAAHTHDGGVIILAVPNCEQYLRTGDPSIFIHEHFSYFTRESIISLVNKAGLFTVDISVIEGAFIFTISKKSSENKISFENISPDIFLNTINLHLFKLNGLFLNYSEEEVAVYAPVRALNSLYLCKKFKCRLVDDSSEMHNRYLPSLQKSVESFDDMIKNPPKCVLIFSRTFGNKIKEKCLTELKLSNTRILTLNELDTEFAK